MSRREQVNCASLAAILVALLLLAGSYLPSASAAAPAPAAETVAVSVDSDLDPEGNSPSGVRGLTVAQLEADAWGSYRNRFPTEPAPSGQFTTAPEYFAAYEGSAPSFTPGYFAIESNNFPGLFHAFHMVAAQRA